MSSTNNQPEPGTGHKGQTFLVGEHVYIRAIEVGDADTAIWWRNNPWTISPERAEKLIKEEMPKNHRTSILMIVRKSDDMVVGGVRMRSGHNIADISPYVGRVFGSAADIWEAEALSMIVPWCVDEHHRVGAVVYLPANRTASIAALKSVGCRETVRFREQYLIDGTRHDGVGMEYLNSQWVDRLGDPMETVPLEKSGLGTPRPRPARVILDGDPPRNAVKVGPRVYLRPVEEADSDKMAELAMMETDTFHNLRRLVGSDLSYRNVHERAQKKDPPDWIRFSVCLRENDQLIGVVGIESINYHHGHGESESEMLEPAYRGSGYGSEAKHLLMEYAFEDLGLHSIQSFVLFRNTRSAAALRKQGYRDAGRDHWYFVSNGTLGNSAVFDILAEDWRALPTEEEVRS